MIDLPAIDQLYATLQQKKLPPVNSWQPALVRTIDMRIAADGSWYYQKSLIQRPEMVRLFLSILRRDEAGYFLVTPQERLEIQVDDAPFVTTGVTRYTDQSAIYFVFELNSGDQVVLDGSHPIVMAPAACRRGSAPYIAVRDRLWALITRSVYFSLVEYSTQQAGIWGLVSGGEFFSLED